MRDLGDEDLLVFEMYDMVAALSAKLDDCFTAYELKQAQELDPFCRALKLYLQFGSESLPADRKLMRKVTRLAHVYIIMDGMIKRSVKTKQARWDEPTQFYVLEGRLREKATHWTHRELEIQ